MHPALRHIVCFTTAILFFTISLLHGADPSAARTISRGQLGAEVQKQYKGDGIGITLTRTGAHLRAMMQDLEADATPEGLWLRPTDDESHGQPTEPFRVCAEAVGRKGTSPIYLTRSGHVSGNDDHVSWLRAGFMEEYHVSTDGVRQDFLVTTRPAGTGTLQITLGISGALASTADYGVKLVLLHTGREIAYSRLHVTDSTGRKLTAQMKTTSPSQVTIEVDDEDAVYPVRIDPTYSDADWIAMNSGIPSVDGVVDAILVEPNGTLYIGGTFSFAGTVAANSVAKWNGSSWSALGTGLGNAQVNDLVMMGGTLYAGGLFYLGNSVEPSFIAKWNGTAWSSVGTELKSGAVRALVVAGNNLYAGGDFVVDSGGVISAGIAKWDGTRWSALGSGFNGDVYALAVSGTDLYAGGDFTSTGGISVKYVAKWNGSIWSAVGTGMSGIVNALTVSSGVLYAGGQFTRAGGVTVNRVAQWNGSSWSALGSGVSGIVPQIYALAATGTHLYAGGQFTSAGGVTANYLARWDGTIWSAMPGEPESYVRSLAAYGNDLYAGGIFAKAGEVATGSLARWNGSTWQALGSGMGGSVYCMMFKGNDLYVGGGFVSTGNVLTHRIAKWNGSTWSALGTGLNGAVHAMVMDGDAMYVGGQFTTAGGIPASRIAKWDGTQWSALGSGMNMEVYALAINGSILYAGGQFTTAGGVTVNCIAQWNGVQWSALGSGMNAEVYALAVSGNDLYAGGRFTLANGTTADHIARWDGNSWSPLGNYTWAGLDGNVNALLVSGGELYVGGDFVNVYTQSGQQALNGVAKWNGTAWSAVGTGVTGSNSNPGKVFSLSQIDDELYVGGLFTKAGATSAKNIAKWQNGTWHAIGSGVDGAVRALAADGSKNLYLGGTFYHAGTLLTPYLVMARLPPQEIAVEQPLGTDRADGEPAQFGTITLGDSKTLTFHIRNTGHLDLTSLAITQDGTHSSDFVVTGFSATSLSGPNGSTSFNVEFTPAATGTRSARLYIASNDTNENPFNIPLSGSGTMISAPLNPLICAEGSTATLSVAASHPAFALTYEWRKNGAIIKGSTTNALTLPAVKTADAGTYTAIVRASGQTSETSAVLTVVKPAVQLLVVPEGSTLKLPVSITGSAALKWTTSAGTVLSETGGTLTLTKLSAATGSTVYTCTASAAGGTSLVAGLFDVRVFNAMPWVTFDQNMPNGKVGSFYTHQIKLDGGLNESPSVYSARNLPTGLTINTKTGLISGIPTLAKTFTKVSISASNRKGGTSSSEEDIIIEPMPSGIEGTFTGGVARHGLLNDNLGGFMNLTVASSGAVSGSMTLGTTKLSFKGAVRTDSTPPRAAITIPRTGKTTLKLDLDFDPANSLLAATSNLTDNTSNASATGWRQVWKATGTPLKLATATPKLFTLALRLPAGTGLPEGDGYASFTLGKDGKLTLTGKTPDGESFTCGTFAGPQGQVLVYQTLHTPKGSLLGTLDIDPEDTGTLDADILEGLVSWLRPANAKSRVSPLGLGPIDLNAFGARYSPPVSNGFILGLSAGEKASLTFTGGGLAGASIIPTVNTLDILPGNKPSFTSGNPGNVKIATLNAATGLFSGSFTLEDTELRTGASFAGKKLKRTATFNGILTQDGGQPVGLGHFLLPEMPKDAAPPQPATTPTSSEMRSGKVVLQKKATD